MDKQHPHLGATYSTLRQNDGTFCVEVTILDKPLVKVSGFETEVRAATWIVEHKSEVEHGALARKRFFLWKKPIDVPDNGGPGLPSQ